MYCFFSSRRRHTRYWRDWSSDVCSSDLGESEAWLTASRYARMYRLARRLRARASTPHEYIRSVQDHLDRKSVVQGKSVDLGGRRILKKKSRRCMLRTCSSRSVRTNQTTH